MYVSLVCMSMQSPFLLFVHSHLGCMLTLCILVCILRVISFIPLQAWCVGLCACKQLPVLISLCMCSVFLSVLHKDEPVLWFVLLHAAHLCLHVNISLHPDDLIMLLGKEVSTASHWRIF